MWNKAHGFVFSVHGAVSTGCGSSQTEPLTYFLFNNIQVGYRSCNLVGHRTTCPDRFTAPLLPFCGFDRPQICTPSVFSLHPVFWSNRLLPHLPSSHAYDPSSNERDCQVPGSSEPHFIQVPSETPPFPQPTPFFHLASGNLSC